MVWSSRGQKGDVGGLSGFLRSQGCGEYFGMIYKIDKGVFCLGRRRLRRLARRVGQGKGWFRIDIFARSARPYGKPEGSRLNEGGLQCWFFFDKDGVTNFDFSASHMFLDSREDGTEMWFGSVYLRGEKLSDTVSLRLPLGQTDMDLRGDDT
ncbi:hypothetical protein TREMEDRAFT_63755 [Tremella mesenterica DSM 1558]|uniref:uncharacterized protein n=1 Tax=Tremella mesenterica (strain ATCC 24925 / CBS 8224 / DSM 1558 / NBRC 9311 / NRRL Y-6157 / RJB 2259-6 / UBC 559-6) TaxID=578456 RepID=UPI0003F490A4|nr:uncharacterized protein TREMEDRAFT_63755 [Tremella mesenterica DSM 1558]EIW67864.1 hypothetical protein TREMEDRAFT_63755 [Tremella mesenterica DSM 1558]